jgi:hypothetical protein
VNIFVEEGKALGRERGKVLGSNFVKSAGQKLRNVFTASIIIETLLSGRIRL